MYVANHDFTFAFTQFELEPRFGLTASDEDQCGARSRSQVTGSYDGQPSPMPYTSERSLISLNLGALNLNLRDPASTFL